MIAADFVLSARRSAGLRQQGLARRLGISQAAVAKLERRGANPTVATLQRVMHATGHRLELTAVPERSSVDDTLIAANLRVSPAERLARFESWYSGMQELLESARDADAETS
jgi:transcriptional regulator with XRE-family HTH domain